MGLVSLKVDPQTDLVYAGKRHDAALTVLEPFTFNTLAMIRIGGNATYLSIDGEENKLYVVNAPRRQLQVVNLASHQVETGIDVGGEPCRVALMGER